MKPEDIKRMNDFFETHSYDLEPENPTAFDGGDDPDERDQDYGAGIVFVTPDGRVLLLLRSDDADDHPGTWCYPGGHVEDGETTEDAAKREAREELGTLPQGVRRVLYVYNGDSVHFTTFRQDVRDSFTPRLNEEHVDYVWVAPDDLPEPLHPGVAEALANL